MRDILLTVIIFGLIPLVLMRPYVGVLVWSWIGYMNPHRLTWSFAYSFPFAQWIAGATLLSMLFSKEKMRIPWSPVTWTLLVFVLWMSMTTLFAFFPDQAQSEWMRTVKIQLMTFITMMLITTQQRLMQLIVVIVVSLGFYGVKGGFFTVFTGGQYTVWGPEGSFIEGNNEIALALIMTMPLMRFLQLSSNNRWIRLGLAAALVLTGLAVLGSQSRGALVAVVAMLAVLWYRDRHKVITGALLVAMVPLFLSFMPATWHERMETIQEYEQDRSAMGRLNVWKFAFEVAKDRPLVGGGYETFDRSLYDDYLPDIANDTSTYIAADAHSIYFEILGEHGFVGLSLYLLLGILTILSGNRVRRLTKDVADLKWARDLASMVQVSIVGYAAGGMFLGLAYFDLYYHLVAIAVVLQTLVEREVAGTRSDISGAPQRVRP